MTIKPLAGLLFPFFLGFILNASAADSRWLSSEDIQSVNKQLSDSQKQDRQREALLQKELEERQRSWEADAPRREARKKEAEALAREREEKRMAAESAASKQKGSRSCNSVLGDSADSVRDTRGKPIETRQDSKDDNGLAVDWIYADCTFTMQRRAGMYRVTGSRATSDLTRGSSRFPESMPDCDAVFQVAYANRSQMPPGTTASDIVQMAKKQGRCK
jgi:hypothetical protein